MVDRTVRERLKRQRDARVEVGWQEVKVWVPTREDADDVRALAADRRSRAERMEPLLEIRSMDAKTLKDTIEAVREQGTAAYTTPAGPILTLLSKLAEKGDVLGVAQAYAVFARAKPAYARQVADAVPAKINAQYFGRLGVEMPRLMRWINANPGWAESLKAKLTQPPAFARLAEAMAAEIRTS